MDKDPLLEEAIKIVCQYDRASASLLQRKLSIGYARAARLLDSLEELGVVGPGEGSKPRDVLVKNTDEFFRSHGKNFTPRKIEVQEAVIDPFIEDAIRIVCQYDSVAVSLLQRKFSIGYARAAMLFDQLEDLGIIGQATGSSPRKVNFKSYEDFKNSSGKSIPPHGNSNDLVINNAKIIEKTLDSFNITAVVMGTRKLNEGSIQYCLEVAVGTNLDDIIKHGKDIALAVASPTGNVDIQAPIPGRSLVGITVPSKIKKFEELPVWRRLVGGFLLSVCEVSRKLADRIYQG